MRAKNLFVAITTIAISTLAASASALVTLDFESIALDGAGVYNGSGGAGYFYEGGATFKNNFTDFGGGCCWDGWAASNNIDSTTPGFGNQYSAYPGSAASGSQFAMAFTDSASITLGTPATINGGYFTNGTYTALSMLNGDSFAKKFGGVTGDDPDFFNVTIEGWLGGISTGSTIFTLADFTFPDQADDYIVDVWTWVDLSMLNDVDTLSFTFASSDVGSFGVNTPSYLALDGLQLVPEPSTALLVGLGLVGLAGRRPRR